MKSPQEIQSACQFFSALLSGQWPIHFNKQDRRILEAQYHVLCWIQEHEGNECFQGSINSLKDLIGQIGFYEQGRKFQSKVLVE